MARAAKRSAQERKIRIAKEIISQNLARLLEERATTTYALGRDHQEISQRQLHDMLNAVHDPRVDRVQAVAKVFGLEAWQLLVPPDHPAGKLWGVYVQASDTDKRRIETLYNDIASRLQVQL